MARKNVVHVRLLNGVHGIYMLSIVSNAGKRTHSWVNFKIPFIFASSTHFLRIYSSHFERRTMLCAMAAAVSSRLSFFSYFSACSGNEQILSSSVWRFCSAFLFFFFFIISHFDCFSFSAFSFSAQCFCAFCTHHKTRAQMVKLCIFVWKGKNERKTRCHIANDFRHAGPIFR